MKKFKCILLILISAAVLFVAAMFTISGYVQLRTRDRILSADDAAALTDVDCILVLGCSVKADGSPSSMLYDRIVTGTGLYFAGASPKILMSGDHGEEDYDEVGVMKEYAIRAGVPSTDVFMDHAGFSTYESVCRAKEIFGVKKMIIVSQEYHLSRALYIAEHFDIEAYGVSASLRPYTKQTLRDIREVCGRAKDFCTSIIKPAPTYLGEKIPLDGDGDVTNDK